MAKYTGATFAENDKSAFTTTLFMTVSSTAACVRQITSLTVNGPRFSTKTKAIEKVLKGEYYPDHVYKNRLYLSTSKDFSFGDLVLFGYNGSKWNVFAKKIDFATLNNVKKIQNKRACEKMRNHFFTRPKTLISDRI